MNCDLKFKCKDQYDFHNLKYSQEVNIKEIEKFLMSTCQCDNPEHLSTCKVDNLFWIMDAQRERHTKKHHGSSPKPPLEEIDDKHEEEVDKASTDEEHTNDGAL